MLKFVYRKFSPTTPINEAQLRGNWKEDSFDFGKVSSDYEKHFKEESEMLKTYPYFYF
jgi:hypothetical protein